MPQISLAKQSSLQPEPRQSWSGLLTFCLLAALPTFAAPCDRLSSLLLKSATITQAEDVAPGAFTQPGGRGGKAGATNPYANLPGFCRVAATLKPTPDSEIKIEVWLPASGWNASLESVGNGAWAGTIGYAALATAVSAGYAAAGTDTGHSGGAVTFVVSHPERLTDFAYRAVHEMTVAAKAITAAYYGASPKHSYFNGCSTGGRQALTEAQRYPNDYDGIIAGDPDTNAAYVQGSQLWISEIAHVNEAAYIPPAKYAAIHNAVLEACDALDGVKDRVIEDPKKCHFDPAALECKGADSNDCLTAAQVATAKKTYAGLKPVVTGLEYGSETGWSSLSGPQPLGLALDTYQYLVFNDPKWDYHTLNAERDIPYAEKITGQLMDADNANLKPFFSHGGKLLMYHGWADPGIPPMFSVNYYTSVVEKMGGAKKTSDEIRLFMVPGMGHCAGGDGPNTFNAMSALAQWVEQKKAPDQIVATHSTRGTVDRTRPLCPYPQTAVYKGSGSTDEAANFSCK